MKRAFAVVAVCLLLVQFTASDNVESCSSPIYCQGQLLDTIQQAHIFNDSKSFVDLSLVKTPDETLKVFDNLMVNTSNNPTQDQLKSFVGDYFTDSGELDNWSPPDFKENPSFLEKISDIEVKDFAKHLIAIWPTLGRKVKQEVFDHPEKHSLIPLPNGFIIPGGRFKEIYYWDSYWIVKGLLISEMTETVRGILENFLSLIEKYGFIPNGSRVYYLNRSQPPFLTMMVNEYIKATNNITWLKDNIQIVEDELNFWIRNRSITVQDKNSAKYKLAHYSVESNTPRPESYIEDIRTCAYQPNENKKKSCYQNLKSGAETGWDFTTRWIFDDEGVAANLSNIQTRRNIPVDLNAFLQGSFSILSELYAKLGEDKKQQLWKDYADLWEKGIEAILYNEEDGIWYDYDSIKRVPKKGFYPSNFAPLWTGSYNKDMGKILGERAAEYFERENVTQYQGGVPSSLNHSGEQWDFPNAWPPLQDIILSGLYKSKGTKAKEIAKEFISRWVKANMRGYSENGEMFEKYDAEVPGQFGGGGEYVVQSGFGWTNGVVLSFIHDHYTGNRC